MKFDLNRNVLPSLVNDVYVEVDSNKRLSIATEIISTAYYMNKSEDEDIMSTSD